MVSTNVVNCIKFFYNDQPKKEFNENHYIKFIFEKEVRVCEGNEILNINVLNKKTCAALTIIYR